MKKKKKKPAITSFLTPSKPTKQEKLETCSEMCCPEVPPPEMLTLRSRGSARKGELRRGTHADDDDDGFGMSGRGETFELPFPNDNPRERESERSQARRRPFQ